MKAAGWVFLTTGNEADNTEADDDNHSTTKTSPGVLSDNSDLKCDDTFTDTQFIEECDEVVNEEGIDITVTEDGDDENEPDAQSLGLDTSLPEIETVEVAEGISDEVIDLGM